MNPHLLDIINDVSPPLLQQREHPDDLERKNPEIDEGYHFNHGDARYDLRVSATPFPEIQRVHEPQDTRSQVSFPRYEELKIQRRQWPNVHPLLTVTFNYGKSKHLIQYEEPRSRGDDPLSERPGPRPAIKDAVLTADLDATITTPNQQVWLETAAQYLSSTDQAKIWLGFETPVKDQKQSLNTFIASYISGLRSEPCTPPTEPSRSEPRP